MNVSRLVSRNRGLLSLAAALSVLSCASTAHLQPGNPLPGVGLGASGDNILLSWDENGPLGTRLRPNTTVELVASYPSDYGNIRNEAVTSAVVQPGFQRLAFKLPDRLKQEPTGQVCMRLVHNRSAIPVRIPQFNESSDAFHYSEWETNAAQDTKREILAWKLGVYDEYLSRYSDPDQSFASWSSTTGLSSVAQCDTLTTEVSDESEPPETALPPAARGAAAKQHCTFAHRRLALYMTQIYGFSYDAGAADSEPPAQLAQALRSAVPAGSSDRRTADMLYADLSSHTPRRYFPLPQWGLPLSSASINALKAVDGELSVATAGAVLEAYDACLSEASRRFEDSYTSWVAANNAGTLEARSEPMRRDCRARFSKNQNRIDQIAQIRQERDAIAAELQALPRGSTALPRQKELVGASCSLNG